MSAMILTLLLLQQGELAAIRRASLRDSRHLPMWLILEIDVGNRLACGVLHEEGFRSLVD
jgi:hypothetical protein